MRRNQFCGVAAVLLLLIVVFHPVVNSSDMLTGNVAEDNVIIGNDLLIDNTEDIEEFDNPIVQSSTTFVYDNNGNLVDDDRRIYTYDSVNRITQLEDTSTSLVTSFTYDAFGNKVSSTCDGESTFFVGSQEYDAEAVLLREYISSTALVDYTSLGDSFAGVAEVLYYVFDVLGSVVALVDSGGVVVERYLYDPYGETVIVSGDGSEMRSSSAFGNPFMWTGQRYDPVSGLYHFWARSYDPVLGRWLQRDPLGYVDGMNVYEYVSSNPVRFVDPLGLIGGPGDTSDLWLGSNQAHEVSSAAGDAYDNGVSIVSYVAMGGVMAGYAVSTAVSRLGIAGTTLFVGECAVDEIIEQQAGPDAAIFVDTMVGGPGFYSAKELAERGTKSVIDGLKVGKFKNVYIEGLEEYGSAIETTLTKRKNNARIFLQEDTVEDLPFIQASVTIDSIDPDSFDDYIEAIEQFVGYRITHLIEGPESLIKKHGSLKIDIAELDNPLEGFSEIGYASKILRSKNFKNRLELLEDFTLDTENSISDILKEKNMYNYCKTIDSPDS